MKLNGRTLALFTSAMLVAVGLATTGGAVAQTATDLNCDGCVDTKDIGNEAVTSKKIKNGSVKNADLANNAKATGTHYVLNYDSGPLTETTKLMTIKVGAPGKGYVIVQSSGYFYFTSEAGQATCSLTTGTDVPEPSFKANGGDTNQDRRVPFGAVNVFPVEKGKNKFNLVCSPTGDVQVQRANLVGMYVPNKYKHKKK